VRQPRERRKNFDPGLNPAFALRSPHEEEQMTWAPAGAPWHAGQMQQSGRTAGTNAMRPTPAQAREAEECGAENSK
jgi:hypothetical protein